MSTIFSPKLFPYPYPPTPTGGNNPCTTSFHLFHAGNPPLAKSQATGFMNILPHTHIYGARIISGSAHNHTRRFWSISLLAQLYESGLVSVLRFRLKGGGCGVCTLWLLHSTYALFLCATAWDLSGSVYLPKRGRRTELNCFMAMQ